MNLSLVNLWHLVQHHQHADCPLIQWNICVLDVCWHNITTNIHLFQTKEFKKDFCGLLFFLRRHFLHRQHQGQHLNLSNTLSSWINACKSDITITHSCSSQHFSLRLDSSPVKIHILIEYIHMQSIHVMFEKERKCHTLHFITYQ